LRVRFKRIGGLVSPNELARQVFGWQRCPECKDGGILGNAVDRDLRFCGCPAGIEAQYPPSDRTIPAEERLHKGPDWPAEEIARVHASTKSLLVAAYGEIAGETAHFIARMIESAEVVDDGKQIAIRPANPKDTEWLQLHVLYGVMSRVGLADRTVEVEGIHTAAFDPAKQAAPPEPPRKQTAEAAPQVPEPERDQRGLCAKCGGPGVLADGAFCECSMGRDLERLARHDKAAKKGPLKEARPRKS
jgi:hypothetical protein